MSSQRPGADEEGDPVGAAALKEQLEALAEDTADAAAPREGPGPVLGRTVLGVGVAALLVTLATAGLGRESTPWAGLLVVAGATSLACAVGGWALSRLEAAERVRRLEREALVEEIQEMLFRFEDRLIDLERALHEPAAEGRSKTLKPAVTGPAHPMPADGVAPAARVRLHRPQ